MDTHDASHGRNRGSDCRCYVWYNPWYQSCMQRVMRSTYSPYGIYQTINNNGYVRYVRMYAPIVRTTDTPRIIDEYMNNHSYV